MTLRRLLNLRVPLLAVAFVALAACTEDNTDTTTPTLDATFVGYSNPDTRQTTCGNCHIEKQRAWQETRHANAWLDLQESGHAQASCNPCHTTSGYSTADTSNTGFFGVSGDAQKYYYDVQCEACHGAGGAHVAGPETTQPIATIRADTGLSVGCGTCHSGEHNPFVEQWRSSGHGQFMTGQWRSPCWNCHESTNNIVRFDPDAGFIERGTTQYQQVAVCATCHDPHGGPNDKQLRLPVNERDLTNNLCMQCHNNRAAPTTGSSRSNTPHGIQGQVFLGTAGWIPAGFTYDTAMRASHGNDANPRTCAGCHVNSWSATAGGLTTYSVGHDFNPTPCVDANGVPTGAPLGGCPVNERSFRACAVSGCHPSEISARASLVAESTLVQSMLNTLWIDVDHDEVIDAFPADSGLLPKVKQLVPTGPTSCTPSDATISVCDGAEFNTRMLGINLYPQEDKSLGVHNPFFYEALLIATINAVRSTYGLPAPPAERTRFAQIAQRWSAAR